MDDFEIGRLLGRFDALLEGIPEKKKYLENLESQLRYRYNIIELAKMYGKIEQKLIIAGKDPNYINSIRELFKEIEISHVNEFRKKSIKDLRLRNFPLKSLNSNNLFTVEDVANKTFEEIVSINGISELSANMLRDTLEKNGVHFKRQN